MLSASNLMTPWLEVYSMEDFADFGSAGGARPKAAPMLSVSNLMILWLEVGSVEDFADFGSAGADPADYSVNIPSVA